MSDRLALANAIEDAGIERAKAERVASVIVDLIRDNVATKADVQASEAAIRHDMQTSEAALRANMQASEAAVRGELRIEIASIRTLVSDEAARLDAQTAAVAANLVLVQHQLMTRVGGLAVVLTGIIIAALHYWQPR